MPPFLHINHRILALKQLQCTPPENTPEYMSAKSQYLQGSGASITDDPANVPMINELFRFRFLGQMNHSYLRVFPVIVTVAIPTGGDHNGQRY